MCGIAGKVAFEHLPDRSVVQRMTDHLRHRGPDSEGILTIAPHVVFGHRRLSIIDLSASANQPMQDATQRYTIVYNGEVYNFGELKDILIKAGYLFKTQSDTEVVLSAFIHWGTACFAKFNGMFALAIWDSQTKRLILARDRFGKKPLYYTLLNNEMTFASEVTALLADEAIKSRAALSIAGLNHYLAIGYILAPLTIYQEIFKLEPATYLCYQDGKIVEQSRYWDYRACFAVQTTETEQDIAHHLDELLQAAVKYRLISDVPVGAFLSGGIDSSGITAYAKRLAPYALHTFNVGFAEASYDEAADARVIAEYLQTIHHAIVPQFTHAEDAIRRTIACYDEPFSDTSLIPMVLVSEFASRFVKVVLSGDGGDEIFGGYMTYQADQFMRRLKYLPQPIRHLTAAVLKQMAVETRKKTSFGFKLKQFAKGIAHDPTYAHYAWRELYDESERIALIGREHAEEIRASHPFLTFRQYYEEVNDFEVMNQHFYVDVKTWLVDDILVKIDRATMTWGLEARAPYLDADVTAYAASIPLSLKIGKLGGKTILKTLFAKYLPTSTIHKKKAGFNAPVNAWLGNAQENEFRYFNQYVWQQGWSALKTLNVT